MSKYRSNSGLVFVAALLSLQPACYAWQPASLEQLAPAQPQTTRLTLANGSRVEMVNGVLINDTVIVARRDGGIGTKTWLSVARRDVRKVELLRYDGEATAMVAIVTAVGVVYLVGKLLGNIEIDTFGCFC